MAEAPLTDEAELLAELGTLAVRALRDTPLTYKNTDKTEATVRNGLSATIDALTKNVGDEVEEGDVVAEVSTEKVNGEVEAPVEGIVVEIVVNVGDVIPVGAPIAYIEDEG